MKLVLGFILGVIVATATSLSAEMGAWLDPENGRTGTYWNGPLGTEYRDSLGNSTRIQQMPMPSYKSPC